MRHAAFAAKPKPFTFLTIALSLVLTSCAPSGSPQTLIPRGAVQPNTALGNAATEGAAGPSTMGDGGSPASSVTGSSGGGANEGNGAARTPGETAAQPAPMGGTVFAPGPNPQEFCGITVEASWAVDCVRPKSSRMNVSLRGGVHHTVGCILSEKGDVLRVVNNSAPAPEFIDILVGAGRDGNFQYSLNARSAPAWEFYFIEPSQTPTYVSLGDPLTAVFDMIPCRDDACAIGEGRAPLEATVQFEKRPPAGSAKSLDAPPPDCAAPKSKEGKGVIILKELDPKEPPKETGDGVYRLLN